MKYLYGIIFLFSINARAQVNPGPRFSAMAGAGVSLQDVWSLQQNQAGIASLKRISFAVGFQKPFAGYELSTQSAVLALPVKQYVFGIGFQRYGLNAYSEQRAGLTYARSFGNKLFTSLNFNYHVLKISGYGSAQTYSVEAGLQYQINKDFLIGLHVANPGKGEYRGGVNASVPSRLQIGAAYSFSNKVVIALAAEENLSGTADGKLGIEYKLVELIALRGGVSANPFKQYAGFGLNYSHFTLDMAVASQPIVGYSPQIALSYEF